MFSASRYVGMMTSVFMRFPRPREWLQRYRERRGRVRCARTAWTHDGARGRDRWRSVDVARRSFAGLPLVAAQVELEDRRSGRPAEIELSP